MAWKTLVPNEPKLQEVLATYAHPEGRRYIRRSMMTDGKILPSQDFGGGRPIAWTDIPKHVAINPAGWLSEYRGDDLPDIDDWYYVCRERSYHVETLWYDTKKGRWLATSGDIIAWRPRPAPYKGIGLKEATP